MKIHKLLYSILIAMAVIACAGGTYAQEKSMGPIERYERKEGGGLTNDFIVEFLIPKSNSWRIVASGNKEKKVLGRSTYANRAEGDRTRIIVTTGQTARKAALYFGNIHAWANSLTIYYVPVPRRP